VTAPDVFTVLVRADDAWSRRQADEPAAREYLQALADAVRANGINEPELCALPHRDPDESTAQALIHELRRLFDAAVEVGLVDGGDAGPAGWADRIEEAIRAAGHMLAEPPARLVPPVAHIHAYDVDEHGRPQPCPCGHVHPWIAAALRRGEQPPPVVALRSVP
jgi:hypothetical protein